VSHSASASAIVFPDGLVGLPNLVRHRLTTVRTPTSSRSRQTTIRRLVSSPPRPIASDRARPTFLRKRGPRERGSGCWPSSPSTGDRRGHGQPGRPAGSGHDKATARSAWSSRIQVPAAGAGPRSRADALPHPPSGIRRFASARRPRYLVVRIEGDRVVLGIRGATAIAWSDPSWSSKSPASFARRADTRAR